MTLCLTDNGVCLAIHPWGELFVDALIILRHTLNLWPSSSKTHSSALLQLVQGCRQVEISTRQSCSLHCSELNWRFHAHNAVKPTTEATPANQKVSQCLDWVLCGLAWSLSMPAIDGVRRHRVTITFNSFSVVRTPPPCVGFCAQSYNTYLQT